MTHPSAKCVDCGVTRAEKKLFGSLSEPDRCSDCFFMNGFWDSVDKAPREALVSVIKDIASRLWLDEDGKFCPEESTAGHSAADFVDSVEFSLRSLRD